MTGIAGERSESSPFRTKISGFDPLLSSVRTSDAPVPLRAWSMLLDPPVERASNRPRCCLDFDRRIDFSAIGFAVLTRIEIDGQWEHVFD